MATAKTLMTADDLSALPDDGYRYELLWGELHRMAPPDLDHATHLTDFGFGLEVHVRAGRLGDVLTGDPGIYLSRDPDLVLAPDLAFYRAGRLPPRGQRRGWTQVVPDLVLEIVSPNDRPGEVQMKVDLWLRFGVPLVWVFDGPKRTLTAQTPGGAPRVFGPDDTLDGGDVLPDFRLPMAEFFRD